MGLLIILLLYSVAKVIATDNLPSKKIRSD